uniref:Uncharacterized protein n=1 Tax=Myoviridae sp. ctNQV2 TaxID=2827683 RepID=A0A8S5S066_9CAUD|nr:MAG TPA: hypothetical protein [Myoviridae sp. ctNQV2]
MNNKRKCKCIVVSNIVLIFAVLKETRITNKCITIKF